MATLSMTRKEDALRLVELWGERLAVGRRNNVSPSLAGSPNEKEPQMDVAEAASGGLALLSVLVQLEEEAEDGEIASGEMRTVEKAEAEAEAAWLCQRVRELMVEAMICTVEACVKCTVAEEAVEASCSLIESSFCHVCKKMEGQAAKIRQWWEYEEIAELGWRWCEAHLTLLPSDESVWYRESCQNPALMANWWWRPDAMSAANQSATQQTTTTVAWPFFKGVISGGSALPGTEAPRSGLQAAAKFLDALNAASGLFAHRIAVGRDVLRRVYVAKTGALLRQARLLACLSFVKNAAGNHSCVDKTKGAVEAYDANGTTLLWVSREGLSLAWQCLVAATTAVQVATAHFDASCEDLQRQIRWALLGVGNAGEGEGGATPQGNGVFFLHPCAEPSENIWRISHGVGLVATGRIPEGAVILRERPSLFADPSTSPTSMPDTYNAELSVVAGAALDLFRRGGVSHKDDVASSQAVEALRSGVLFGHATRAADMWAALHLLVTMPLAESVGVCDGNGLARDVSDLVRGWNERAIAQPPAEGFRIQQGGGTRRGRGLYPLASLINHSCSPNTLRLFSDEGMVASACGGNDLYIVALRDIEPGEEITVTYLSSLLLPRSVKRLQNGFWCRCIFCQSHAALLEGVVCPFCQRLIYDDDNNNNSDGDSPSMAARVDLCGERSYEARGGVAQYAHAADCVHAGSSSSKGLVGHVSEDFKKAISAVHDELLKSVSDADAVNTGGGASSDNAQRGHKPMKNESVEDDDQYARRAQRAMRRLMDIDAFAHGLPPTHHCRLQARMECLAISLNAAITPYDSGRLLHLCEELLEDLEVVLPRNYPLLTDIRLHYCLVRSRHVIATTDVDDPDLNGEGEGCCGAVREQAETVRLPFVQDAIIRESVVRSFQEYYVQAGWQFAESEDNELLECFLGRYAAELFACGVDRVSQINMLSLMYDAARGNTAE
ncbi:hypothetical protein DQ04_00681020 [Trypanosoma grayi]|uniref:hypothetical protein n=1 Tax=Trypanosoma grayi TaxID=71804 RepID=UPI0004F3F599|nr:hypothetical protein DQ04_00681020 [Trypanosoma grayi]KEG13978.1 hypothetical protein DQ04_00681020 [Trypanosoma grayi]